MGPSLTAPVVEELLKGAGLVLLYLIVRDEVDDMMDGFVYGALCGLGFAVVEDVVYFMAGFGGTRRACWKASTSGRVERSVRARALHRPGGHGDRTRRDQARSDPVRRRLPARRGIIVRRYWVTPCGTPRPGALAGPPVQAEWLLVPVDLAIKGLPLLLFVLVAPAARTRERRWLDGALSSEVGLGGVTAEGSPCSRPGTAARGGPACAAARAPAARLLARLQREQVDLAMVSSRADHGRRAERVAQRACCTSLRAALERSRRGRRRQPGIGSAARWTWERSSQASSRGTRARSRAISLVEDGDDGLALSAGVFRTPGRGDDRAHGAPGVGKSTIATALVRRARADGRRVAVLAIDPTSPYTGGALLGDRVRMQEHATDPEVFIRSMATRGHLGGMSLAAPEAVRILDAAGFDLVIVETVGVGQAEIEVAAATDTTIVALAPGLGDAIQMAKAGI